MKARIGIRKKLILSIFLSAAAVILSCVTAISCMSRANAAAADITDNYARGEVLLAEIRGSVLNIQRMAFSHVAATNYDVMTNIAAAIKSENEALESSISRYEQYVSDEDKALYRSLISNCEDLNGAAADILCASADGRKSEAYMTASGDAALYTEAAVGCTDQLLGIMNSRMDAAKKRISDLYALSVAAGIVLAAVCTVTAVLSVKLLNGIIDPVTAAARSIKDGSDGICAAAGELRGLTEKSRKKANDLSGLSKRFSEDMERAAEESARISGSVSEIQSSAGGITEKCAEIAEYSSELTVRADNIERNAEENIRLISEKAENISELLSKAVEESKSVDRVNSLTQDIVQIASTTNLIAMNATIEAKHAGAAGSGFSLVAGEIKQLAFSCSRAANSISEVNETVTSAVHQLSELSEELLDHLNGHALDALRGAAKSGRQYRSDSERLEKAAEELRGRTETLQATVSGIADSAGNVVSALKKSADSVSAAAADGKSLAEDINTIDGKVNANIETAEELRRQTTALSEL